MNHACFFLVLMVFFPSIGLADENPVTIRLPEAKAWTGQKVSFYLDLRASGTFDGTASFSLPKIPQTVIIKVGNPVVSSEEKEGNSWFIQSHEFALFSQQTGTVTIPSFEVRFASRDGFTGPVSDQTGTVPETTVEMHRPPGSDQFGFLVTTETVEIRETWEPQPGPAKVGEIFKRTIRQSADQMTGMALSPPPPSVPDGVRVYWSDPQITDNTERGAFTGQRQDTLTYVLQKPGKYTLPAIRYVWWNPKTEKIHSKTLPAVTFDVAALQVASNSQELAEQQAGWIWWCGGTVLICGLIVWQRGRIASTYRSCRQTLNPPDRVFARQLLRACRRNDAIAASRVWTVWLNLQDSRFTAIQSLQVAVMDLQRHVYGPQTGDTWQGQPLAQAFRVQQSKLKSSQPRNHTADLPLLNPSS